MLKLIHSLLSKFFVCLMTMNYKQVIQSLQKLTFENTYLLT